MIKSTLFGICLLASTACVSQTPASTVSLAQVLSSSPERAAADKARDAGRKPAAVLAFLGIEDGMTVIDLVAAGGYYTEVLSLAVGVQGRVYAQNPQFVLEFRNGANDKALTARLADDRLSNVVRKDGNVQDMGIAANSIDAAFTALNFHDVYNNGGPEAAINLMKVVFGLLKPGGVLGIVDHHGKKDADNKALHRIYEPLVREAAEKAGFELTASSRLLHNHADNHQQFVFAEGLRGQTDRFLLKLTKPTE